MDWTWCVASGPEDGSYRLRRRWQDGYGRRDADGEGHWYCANCGDSRVDFLRLDVENRRRRPRVMGCVACADGMPRMGDAVARSNAIVHGCDHIHVDPDGRMGATGRYSGVSATRDELSSWLYFRR